MCKPITLHYCCDISQIGSNIENQSLFDTLNYYYIVYAAIAG